MKIDVLCSDPSHPVWDVMGQWVEKQAADSDVALCSSLADCRGGDILFLISCAEIVGKEDRSRYGRVFVIHASDLPEGRGWSPLVWQVLEGRKEIVLTLFEAADRVDDGAIWKKKSIQIEPHELSYEIHAKLFRAETELMDYALEHYGKTCGTPQPQEGGTYYRKRSPEDSCLDPDQSIKQQFDLLRISDPDRYPAFFKLHGHTYKLTISKLEKS